MFWYTVEISLFFWSNKIIFYSFSVDEFMLCNSDKNFSQGGMLELQNIEIRNVCSAWSRSIQTEESRDSFPKTGTW